MSVMSQLCIDLEDMIANGYSDNEIASALGVSIMIVSGFREEYISDDYFDDSMDGDFDSGMASAGHGTDESYGNYSDEY